MAAAARVAWELCAMMFSASWRRLFKALLPVPLSIFHPWNINAVFPELFFKGRPLVLGVEISEAIDLQVDPGHSAREPEAIPGWCAENLPNTSTPASQNEYHCQERVVSVQSLVQYFFLSAGYRVSGNRLKLPAIMAGHLIHQRKHFPQRWLNLSEPDNQVHPP